MRPGRRLAEATQASPRAWWPAGLRALTPDQRHVAIDELGAWPDGNYVLFVDGRRCYLPVEARRLRTELGVE
jgi:hypothetical protein